MVPISFPELPKPSRTLGISKKTIFQNPNFYIEIRYNSFHFLLGHNSEPCGNFATILRHKRPIITPDLPIPARRQNSSVKREFFESVFLYKILNFSFLISLFIPLKGPIRGGDFLVRLPYVSTAGPAPGQHPGCKSLKA